MRHSDVSLPKASVSLLLLGATETRGTSEETATQYQIERGNKTETERC